LSSASLSLLLTLGFDAAATFGLLSPAAASYGFFKNFEERGNVFKELVRMK
jgi:UDP-N-acetylmuramoylalanine-D-glutamate ligase